MTERTVNEDMDSTKPIIEVSKNHGRKTRPDDKRGKNNPLFAKKIEDPDARKAFCSTQFRPKWANHPIKELIIKWIEAGFSAEKICEKIGLQCIKDEGNPDDYNLSVQTMTKIRRRHLHAVGALKQEETQSRVTTVSNRQYTESEKVLWDTVKDCEVKKKDPSISPKDWQYFDQQQQSALTLINDLKSEGKGGEDIAVVISRVFAQFVKRLSPDAQRPDAVSPGTTNNAGQEENKPL